ncbi:hypothetical protein LNKW23_45690 [Paralimibaculum aggregatum]|uniref:CRISPR-associated endonuclease Cas1 n=1 Tax=Paralimibaculum aggregatum TaxID=3036245 RepID=A0ABQ6LTF0_9RHOB|nr:CRISPR-associated endonuclease Cas1 [Limibaculum sp. NKW23]GMG85349.1 hypothetical protein LNKW23_45690 [Limibaculum sp. NKW23]
MPRARPAPNASRADIFARVARLDILDRAWDRVRSNMGCAGGDGETVEAFRARASKRLILLSRLIAAGTYRPRDLRVLHIPKKGGETRPLAIPSVEDRVVQTAAAFVLGPILDPGFDEASHGYRPGRGVETAIRAVEAYRKQGFTHVVEADIRRCFERIPHDLVLARLEAELEGRAGASRVVDLVGLWLEQAGAVMGTPGIGLAQGSPLSPLLANLHLDALDEATTGPGIRLVRYADDFLVLCRSEALAGKALDKARRALTEAGLEIHSEGTRIVDFDRGFRFLGHLFVRSLVLRQVADPEEDAVELLRDIGREDRTEVQAARARDVVEAEERAGGYDRGQRVLHLDGDGRRLVLRNLSFSVRGEEERELIAIAPTRVDRIELGPRADAELEALRHALGTGTELAFLNGHGETLGWLTSAGSLDRATLHIAQARMALDPALAADLARRIVDGRLRNQRAQLQRLNRTPKDAEIFAAVRTIGRIIRKLPRAGTVAALRGHEGEAGALYWPALGRLAAGAPTPLRRSRPANDPFNAALNYLTALLIRDIRTALMRRGLHPGIGVLHVARDGGEACTWDLIEGFRAPLAEGLAATLFNQGRLKTTMFEVADGSVRIGRDARLAIIRGYETAASRVVKNPRSGRRRTWRGQMEEEAGAYAAHCRDPQGKPFEPLVIHA